MDIIIIIIIEWILLWLLLNIYLLIWMWNGARIIMEYYYDVYGYNGVYYWFIWVDIPPGNDTNHMHNMLSNFVSFLLYQSYNIKWIYYYEMYLIIMIVIIIKLIWFNYYYYYYY